MGLEVTSSEVLDVKRRSMVIVCAGIVAAAALAGGTVAYASGSDDTPSVQGPDADRAVAAALAAVGGRANSVERDGEDGATWEVEVTRSDGTTVDVRLDAGFKVVVVEGDSEAHDSGD